MKQKLKTVFMVIFGMLPLFVILLGLFQFFDYLLFAENKTFYRELMDYFNIYNRYLATTFFTITYLSTHIIVIGSLYYTSKLKDL